MKTNLLCILCLFIQVITIAQYKTAKKAILLFNNSSNQITTSGLSTGLYKTTWAGGFAEYRDSITNQLMFYTQGKAIYDGTGATAINGTGLLSGFTGTHNATIIPVAPNIFCVITTEQSNGTRFAYYSKVKTGYVNGAWTAMVDPIIKNVPIVTPTGVDKFASKTVVLKKANGYWLVMHDATNVNNNLILFKISNGSVVPVYDRTFSVGTMVYSATNADMGQMRCGDYDAAGNCNLVAVYSWDQKVDVYTFNYDTGNIGLVTTIDLSSLNYLPFGCEISPNNKMLYVGNRNPSNSISSFDLTAANIANSRITVTLPTINGNVAGLGHMQILDNGKIYFPIGSKRSIVIIQNPDNIAGVNGINMNTDVITATNNLTTGLPNYPRY
jgi:hypothetical protein